MKKSIFEKVRKWGSDHQSQEKVRIFIIFLSSKFILYVFLSFIEVFLFKRYRAVILGYIIFIKYSFIDQLSMKRTHFNVA